MKNHLSMLGSIGAGARFSLAGMGGSWLGSTRLVECLTVTLVVETSPGVVLPVMSFSQASAHSRTMSVAYFLFLHSPVKANWFSGFPSGIL